MIPQQGVVLEEAPSAAPPPGASGGYQAAPVPSAPYPQGEDHVEDRGLLGAAGGAAAVVAGGAAAHHFGAFGGGKHDESGGMAGFAHDHPGLALVAGVGAVAAGAFAGHKLEDAMK